ncbi:transcriptional regulator [Streptomyces sp. NPDC007083]|uniref:transcriptional regulator n=1 Tax=unclassified Streptomyces TaxID=2593676 RepID=UPI0033D545E4
MPARPRPTPAPSTLHRLAAERATGAFTRAGGTLFLVDGHIVHAESSAATGLEILLSRGCALSRTCWEAARAQAGRDGGARHLVASGRVPAGVLELCQGVALYDAAFFVLAPDGGPGRFRRGVRHWLGARGGVVPLVVERETVRRLAFLDRIWPDARLDVLPPVPTAAAAPPGHPADPVVRTGAVSRTAQQHPTGRQVRSAAAPGRSSRLRAVPVRQLRILELADGLRTPTDIARVLGRPAFHTLVELRRLAAAGLVAPAPQDRPAAGVPDRYPLPEGGPPGANTAAADGGTPPAGPPGPVFAEPDIALLRRLRDALEAL